MEATRMEATRMEVTRMEATTLEATTMETATTFMEHGKLMPLPKIRLEYLDGLRGLLCLIVVIHHFRCGFQPCGVFGPSAQWLLDPTTCTDSNQVLVFLAPLVNGTFAVAVFFVMSGTVLSNGLLMADDNRWRLAFVKRYFRLLIPCAAAMILAYLLGGMTAHQEAAQITKSKWLLDLAIHRPSPAALLPQILFGIWHNASTLNNAFWTMPIELFGSFLVFTLVAVLRGSSSLVSKRFLAGLMLCLLIPSSTLGTSLSIELEWAPQTSDDIDKVSLNPLLHAHLLQTIDSLQLSIQDQSPQKWYDKDPLPKPLSLDSPKKMDNTELFKEIFFTQRKYKEQHLIKSTKWKTTNPFIWYAPFVAGVWITEHNLRPGTQQQKQQRPWWILVVVAYICATFPLFGLVMDTNPIWKGLKEFAGMLGLGFISYAFYYIVGAICLVQWVVLSATAQQFLSLKWCRWFGKISFSLYLTHIPILYTLTSYLFVAFQGYDYASYIAFGLSVPIMIGVAAMFERWIDTPSLALSATIGKKLLGMPPTS